MARPQTCRKAAMTMNRRGMVVRQVCCLPFRHKGDHAFTNRPGQVQRARAYLAQTRWGVVTIAHDPRRTFL